MSQKIDLDILQGKTNRHLVGDTILLEKETFKAFEKMRNAAMNDGINDINGDINTDVNTNVNININDYIIITSCLYEISIMLT